MKQLTVQTVCICEGTKEPLSWSNSRELLINGPQVGASPLYLIIFLSHLEETMKTKLKSKKVKKGPSAVSFRVITLMQVFIFSVTTLFLGTNDCFYSFLEILLPIDNK